MIYVAPINSPLQGAIAYLLEQLPNSFPSPVEIFQPAINAQVALDESRQQYNSTVLLRELSKELPSPASKIIGVTDSDLYIPVLTFVFGEAQLGGNVAVASSYRLHNAFYGLPNDRGLMLERLLKEVVHELGHTFNLTHCRNFECVMAASSSVEQIDLKLSDLCGACRGLIELSRGANGPRR